LVEVKVGKAKAEDPARAPGAAAHIFKEFFAALVKGRGRYFQRRREAGHPEHDPNAESCFLAKAIDGFVLDTPFGNWEVIQNLVVASAETADADQDAARLADQMDGMGLGHSNVAQDDGADALLAGVDAMDIGE